MPWGDDEQRGMIWIRVFCWGLSIGFVITTYVCGIHTALYHSSIGKDFDRSIPIIHSGFNIFLVATCAIFIIGENYYLKTNDGQAFDPVVSRRLKYLILGFVLAALFGAISNIFIHTALMPLSIWIQRKRFVLMLIVEIVMAICTILNSDQLRSYISKLMTTIYEQAFFLNIYLVPFFLSIIINGGIYIVYKVLDIQATIFSVWSVLNYCKYYSLFSSVVVAIKHKKPSVVFKLGFHYVNSNTLNTLPGMIMLLYH